MENKKNSVYTDILIIISVLAVVAVSVILKKWFKAEVGSISWFFMTALQSIFRFAIPTIIMVSGAKTLSSPDSLSIRTVFYKDILRLAAAFICWSTFCILLDKYLFKRGGLLYCAEKFLSDTLIDMNYMWLVLSLIGLYIVSPLLKRIIEDKSLLEYFLLIWFIFTICGNFFGSIPDSYINFEKINNAFKMSAAIHLSGYFCLGYYLSNYSIKKPLRFLIYALSILSIIAFLAITYYISVKEGRTISTFIPKKLPMTVFVPASVFLLIKNVFGEEKSSPKIISFWAKASFGIFMCHLAVLDCLMKSGILPHTRVIYLIVITTAATYLVSLIISAILNFIPFVKKYIV